MKRHEEEGHENNERWLLTYSDMITLLMIFFILLYTISNVDSKKYQQLAGSLNAALGGSAGILSGGGGGVELGQFIDVGQGNSNLQTNSEEKSLSDAKAEIDEYMKENNLDQYVAVAIDERGLAIRMKDSVLFNSGKADVLPGFIEKIAMIGGVLNKTDGYIRVEGHTDSVPIHNGEFKSNWQLSVVRATNVVQVLVEKAGIKPERISAVGYGEYRPIADNSTAEGRAKNRRVEIVVVNSKYDKVEETGK